MYTTLDIPARLSYAMSSIRTNRNTLPSPLIDALPHWSSTHCGPSGIPEPCGGGSMPGMSVERSSLPLAFFPVAIIFGTLMNSPSIGVASPGAKS